MSGEGERASRPNSLLLEAPPPEREPLHFDVQLVGAPPEVEQLVNNIKQVAEDFLYHWKTFPIILPPSRFTGPGNRLSDIIIAPPCDELDAAALDAGLEPHPLSPKQLHAIREKGEFEVPSRHFPGQTHVWRVAGWLQRGRVRAREELYCHVARAVALIVVVARDRLLRDEPLSVIAGAKSMIMGLQRLLDLAFGMPSLEARDLEKKIREERSRYLVAELICKPEQQEDIALVAAWVSRAMRRAASEKADARDAARAVPAVPCLYSTPQRTQVDLRLYRRDLLRRAAAPLQAILERESRGWFLHFRERKAAQLASQKMPMKDIEEEVRTAAMREYISRVCGAVLESEPLAALGPDVPALLAAQLRAAAILDRAEEGVRRRLEAGVAAAEARLRAARPLAARARAWRRERLAAAAARLRAELRWAALEDAAAALHAHGLLQHRYFLLRDLAFLRDREPLLVKELRAAKSPRREFTWATRTWAPANWVVVRHFRGRSERIPTVLSARATSIVTPRSDPSQPPVFLVHKERVRTTTTRWPGWRILNLAHRTWCWSWNMMFLLGVLVPWCSPLSLRTLICVRPFVPDYELSQVNGTLFPKRSSETQTMWSRLLTLWRHVSKERTRFETEPDTDFQMIGDPDVIKQDETWENDELQEISGRHPGVADDCCCSRWWRTGTEIQAKNGVTAQQGTAILLTAIICPFLITTLTMARRTRNKHGTPGIFKEKAYKLTCRASGTIKDSRRKTRLSTEQGVLQPFAAITDSNSGYRFLVDTVSRRRSGNRAACGRTWWCAVLHGVWVCIFLASLTMRGVWEEGIYGAAWWRGFRAYTDHKPLTHAFCRNRVDESPRRIRYLHITRAYSIGAGGEWRKSDLHRHPQSNAKVERYAHFVDSQHKKLDKRPFSVQIDKILVLRRRTVSLVAANWRDATIAVHAGNALIYETDCPDPPRLNRWLVLFEVLLWRIGILGVLQPIAAFIVAVVFCPLCALLLLVGGVAWWAMRGVWEEAWWRGVVARLARVPAHDSAFCRRVDGPGLHTRAYYQITCAQALAAATARGELEALAAWAADLERAIDRPLRDYAHFVDACFGPFSVQIAKSGAYRQLERECGELAASLREKVAARRRDLALPLSDAARARVRMPATDLRRAVQATASELSRVWASVARSEDWWSARGLELGDWHALAANTLVEVFDAEVLVALEENEARLQLESGAGDGARSWTARCGRDDAPPDVLAERDDWRRDTAGSWSEWWYGAAPRVPPPSLELSAFNPRAPPQPPLPPPAAVALVLHNRESDNPVPLDSELCAEILKSLEDAPDSDDRPECVERYRGGGSDVGTSDASDVSPDDDHPQSDHISRAKVSSAGGGAACRWTLTGRGVRLRADLASPEDVTLDADRHVGTSV
ncbi:uncharacterized protein LOC131852469 [Achroia grisella]|uniref:uncharacterized protein LOC131852469 n=1 Tax=Achroia grisella TaxID=688607 RepID=UPI0027D326FF|nr:uncharacterized protein LOC131852469 [Achroia grisella]